MYVCLNGKFIASKLAKVSVFDHGFLYGDGVYETLRTYNGKIWQLDEHMKRLERSACYLNLKLPYEKAKIAQLVEKLVTKNGFSESRIRVTITRGVNQFNFVTSNNPTLLIVVEELQLQPANIYKRGVKIITIRNERVLPESKNISLLPMVMARQEIEKAKAYEGIFVSTNGYVREGSITNIFIVKNGKVITPKSNVLAGTTRKIVIKIAKKLNLKIEISDFTIRKLYSADEVFITNAPRGIIPVKQVDDRRIGTGFPGNVTKEITKSFNEYIEKVVS